MSVNRRFAIAGAAPARPAPDGGTDDAGRMPATIVDGVLRPAKENAT